MNNIHKRIFRRNDGKSLLLFGNNIHDEKSSDELEITKTSKPHMRWNPSRGEWVTYSSGREKRTFFPPNEYCPFCPSGKINFPTEIPFNDFEIAVFPNRWSSFLTHENNFQISGMNTKPSNGHCEVVVYSSKHIDTVAEMPLERITLLTKTWIDRYVNLLPRDDIKYVLPFENRGSDQDDFYAYGISTDLISDVTSSGLIRVASVGDIEKLDYNKIIHSTSNFWMDNFYDFFKILLIFHNSY